MNIQEIELKSGVPARLIRFLISEGVVPKPSGGRKFASYSDEHLNALSIYSSLKKKGVTHLDVIRQAIKSEPKTRLYRLSEGVELEIRTDIACDVDDLAAHLKQAAEQYIKGIKE